MKQKIHVQRIVERSKLYNEYCYISDFTTKEARNVEFQQGDRIL
jgi:hypothetical protein